MWKTEPNELYVRGSTGYGGYGVKARRRKERVGNGREGEGQGRLGRQLVTSRWLSRFLQLNIRRGPCGRLALQRSVS